MVITLDELNALLEKYYDEIRLAQAHIDVVTELISLAKDKAVNESYHVDEVEEETASEYQTVE